MATHDEPIREGLPNWFDLATPDVEKAAAFYARLFGWVYDKSGAEYGHYHMARVDGRAAAGMGEMQDDSDVPPSWTVYFAADDVDAMTAKAEGLGATVLAAPFEVGDQGRMSIVQDPTGAAFGLWQQRAHAGAGVTGEHGAMTWHEVNTRDPEAAREFYTALFDATAEPMEGTGTTYYTLKKGDDFIGGVLGMNDQWEGIPPHWIAYFGVRDTDAVVRETDAGGGKVSVPPFDTEFGRIAVLADPFGATFCVVSVPDSA